ncbi:MAG TPA: TAT-variant-translocated molybdopterin oxidoreductase [Isosphaeraceae bacterium]|nr:TAT-variant-translocated molybdopterin oxidoreductase [Isosphaeraceae bacterium]
MNLDFSPTDQEGSALTGKTHWRSLEELANTPAFRTWVEHTFPQSMRELLDGAVDRRRFLHLMAASLGLAGLSGCRRPLITAMPYSKPPEEVVPGLPTYYASAMPRPGSARPVLVECHEGRPTKIEGNPIHPDSAGGTDVFAQASVLDLYDPDRSRSVLRAGVPSTWQSYDEFAATHFAALRSRNSRGLHVLAGDVASPSLDLLREHLRAAMPEARWYTYEPVSENNARAGAILAFGSPFVRRELLDRAAVVVALDADILGVEDDAGRHVRGFADGRRLEKPGDPMNRLYAIESRYSLTGGMADHRLRLAASQVPDYTLALAREVFLSDQVVPMPGSESAALRDALATFRPTMEVDKRWVSEVAADLRAHAGRSLVIAGRRQPPLVHALAHAMNASLSNIGKTVELRGLSEDKGAGTLKELVEAIGKNEVDTLVVLGGNPGYDAPADLGFAAAWKTVSTTIRLGMHVDETSANAAWHLPEAHYLESWGDARTGDGTLVPVQPMIEPLFGGRTSLEVLARLSGFEATAPYEIVRRAFRKVSGVDPARFEALWSEFLHSGMLKGSALPPATPALRSEAIGKAVAAAKPGGPLSAENLELVFDRDARVDDGRFANNGWLQEVPDPITKLSWDNAALLSPKTAQALGVATGDLIRLELGGRALEIVALIAPGQADFSVSVSLGYGRPAGGRVGRGVGFNAYALRTTETPDIAIGVRLTKTGRTYPLACTQDHFTMEGRDLVRDLTLANLANPPVSHREEEPAGEILTPPKLDGEHQWGMTIDLNSCVGCNACSIACQSENNIPIVGKDEVARGREMHWIRIDRYFAGDAHDPRLVHQPVACVQCESAPCEVVCPVNATVHNEEGLNVQVYSRCIGTRYCLNNCPYKVRRFNYFNYNERPLDQLRLGPLAEKGMAETLKMQKNPDVTVRIRGVMEKCTYCVQRIERAKIGARVAAGASEHTAVPDGTIVPACAQACPARAIVFGDISDPESRVSRLKAQSRNYSLLGELNTRPHTTYLARLRNPNPKMAVPAGEHV